MKKRLRTVFLCALTVMLLLVSSFVVASCGNKTTTANDAPKALPAPVIEKTGNTVHWSAVQHATGYNVFIDGEKVDEVYETSYTFAETVAGTYVVTVTAVSSDKKYTQSVKSNSLTFVVDEEKPPEGELNVYVTDAPYNAKGNGKQSDRAAIQQAINDVSAAGGGKVILKAGKIFLTGNLMLQSNVELHFEDGAMLKQNTDDSDYIDPVGKDSALGSSWIPAWGSEVEEWEFMWAHAWIYNYPFLYSREGNENVKITGNGTITMMPHKSCDETMHFIVLGFYKTTNIVVSDIKISGYDGYGGDWISSKNILIQNVLVENPLCGCGDGFHFNNCQNVHVTESTFMTGDDALGFLSSYGDPRLDRWASSTFIQPTENIEVDHCHCEASGPGTKGLAFFDVGGGAPDLTQSGIKNVYIHDNYIKTLGLWSSIGVWGPDSPLSTTNAVPAQSFRWENNEILEVQGGFLNWEISDQLSDDGRFNSAKDIHNGEFDYAGQGYWITRTENGSAAGARQEEHNTYGYIENIDKGDAKLYQGLYLVANVQYTFSAKVQTSGAACRLFVADALTGESIATETVDSTEWTNITFKFKVPASANYYVGIERGEATEGWGKIDDVSLENELIYNATTNYRINPATSEWVQNYNLSPVEEPKVTAGQILKIGYYFTVNEVSDENAYMRFMPIVQRKSLNWVCVAEGDATVNYDLLDGKKVLVVFRIKLQDDFDGTDDSLCPRLYVTSGIDITWDKLIIANEDYDFEGDPEYTVVLDTNVNGHLSPGYVKFDNTLFNWEGNDSYTAAENGQAVVQYMDVPSGNDFDLKAGDTIKVALMLTIDEIGDENGMVYYRPLIQRSSINDTIAMGEVGVSYKMLNTGTVVLVFAAQLPDNYDSLDDTIVSKIFFLSSIKFTCHRAVIVAGDVDFSDIPYCRFLFEETLEDWIKIVDVSELIYHAIVGNQIAPVTSEWVQNYNLSACEEPKVTAGQIVKIGYYLTINEVSDENAYMRFMPIVQRKSLNWASVAEGSFTVDYSLLNEDKVLLVFSVKLPSDFDGTDDTLCPRLHVNAGINMTWDKIIIANEDYDFEADPGYKVVLDADVNGHLSPNYAEFEHTLFNWEGNDPYSATQGGQTLVQHMNVLAGNNYNLQAGDIIKMALFLNVNSIGDVDGNVCFSPYIWRDNSYHAWREVFVSYKKLKTGNVVMSFVMKLPDDYDSTIDGIYTRAYFISAISFSCHRAIVVKGDADFENIPDYEFLFEEAIRSGPLSPIQIDYENTLYDWSGDTEYSAAQGGQTLVQNMNVLAGNDFDLQAGDIIKLGLILTVDEIGDENGEVCFSPYIWRGYYHAWREVFVSYKKLKTGAVAMSFVLQLPEDYNSETDDICTRVYFISAIKFKCHRTVVVKGDADFSDIPYCQFLFEEAIRSGPLSPMHVNYDNTLFDWWNTNPAQRDDAYSATEDGYALVQHMNFRDNGTNVIKAGDTIKVALMLTIDEIGDENGMVYYRPLIQRSSIGNGNIATGEVGVSYKMLKTGAVVLVFSTQIPDNYISVDDMIASKIYFQSSIKFTCHRAIVVAGDVDFSDIPYCRFLFEETLEDWDVIYGITYENTDGTDKTNPTTYKIDSDTITLTAISKDGYTFDGWYDNEEFDGDAVTEIVKGTTGNIKLYAKWTAIEYTITYELDGGEYADGESNPEAYTVETETVTLAPLIKDGYTFDGWYDNEEFDGDAVTEIVKGTTGNIALYAKWTDEE